MARAGCAMPRWPPPPSARCGRHHFHGAGDFVRAHHDLAVKLGPPEYFMPMLAFTVTRCSARRGMTALFNRPGHGPDWTRFQPRPVTPAAFPELLDGIEIVARRVRLAWLRL
jgi:hypothetical protein